MRDLNRLLRPRSIAVVGGGAISRFVMENCQKLGFDGDVWHVHPSRGEFKNVFELPSAPDVAFVGVNRHATLEVIADLSNMGSGGAVAYASGFSEAASELNDGVELQSQLLDAAGAMPVIGPNCYGFLNYLDGAGLWPDQQGGQGVDRGVAIITQSSNIAINLTMQRRGLPIAYIVTAGNQAQVGLAEIGAALLADNRVSTLGLHIEGIGDVAAFEGLAHNARAMGKSIVALKAGKSEQAQAATISHTASLAGNAAGATALFRRLGVAEVQSLSELLETLKLLHVAGPLPSNRIASLSCSGGEASLMADRAVGRDVTYPDLTKPQAAALRQALGEKVALANPLDYHTYIWANAGAMGETYAAMMTGDADFGLVVADFPRNDRCYDGDWEPVITGVAYATAKVGKPMAIAASLSELIPEDTATRLIDMGITPLCGMDEALSAVEAAGFIGRDWQQQDNVTQAVMPRDPALVGEAEAKRMLRGYGVDVPRQEQVTGLDKIGESASQIGFPVVVKGEGIAHKTEAGAVAININSASQAYDSASKMRCDSFLVEEMIDGKLAELLIGITVDEAHGYLLTIAAGGTLTEIMEDRAHLLLPTSDADIRAALKSLRISKLLDGYRGAAPVDFQQVVNAINALQSFVIAHQGKIAEVEINPLICTQTRAVAADVLLRMGERDDR